MRSGAGGAGGWRCGGACVCRALRLPRAGRLDCGERGCGRRDRGGRRRSRRGRGFDDGGRRRRRRREAGRRSRLLRGPVQAKRHRDAERADAQPARGASGARDGSARWASGNREARVRRGRSARRDPSGPVPRPTVGSDRRSPCLIQVDDLVGEARVVAGGRLSSRGRRRVRRGHRAGRARSFHARSFQNRRLGRGDDRHQR